MIEYLIISASLLLLLSVIASKVSDRFGIPALLLFLVLGMLAGSDGPGGIYFDDPALAQFIGVVALVLILFSGGLDTDWISVRPVLKEGLLLSTLGVFITAVVVGLFANRLLGFSMVEGLLLGSIVSSTDAAAVFSLLRSKGIGLKDGLRPLIEFESGSNDPMAIFLTVGMIRLLTQPQYSLIDMLGLFFLQMLVGAVAGFVMGRLMLAVVNRVKLSYEGLYPVLTLALVFLTYGLASTLGGNGFLAVYLAGIFLGQNDFIHKRSLLRFHDGLAWLTQIAMFLTLGLLVFPSRLALVAGAGLLIAGCLIVIARPLGVILSLMKSRFTGREKIFISWVGLRGAVPIILATYPLLARVSQAELMFNMVFFVVLASVLLQGTTIPQVARRLGVDAPVPEKRIYPLEFTPVGGLKSELKELPVRPGSRLDGKAIVDMGLPESLLIVLIARENEFVQPSGSTVVHSGDTLLILADKTTFDEVSQW